MRFKNICIGILKIIRKILFYTFLLILPIIIWLILDLGFKFIRNLLNLDISLSSSLNIGIVTFILSLLLYLPCVFILIRDIVRSIRKLRS